MFVAQKWEKVKASSNSRRVRYFRNAIRDCKQYLPSSPLKSFEVLFSALHLQIRASSCSGILALSTTTNLLTITLRDCFVILWTPTLAYQNYYSSQSSRRRLPGSHFSRNAQQSPLHYQRCKTYHITLRQASNPYVSAQTFELL